MPVLRADLVSDSQATAGVQAGKLNSAARRADGYLPPACANPGYHHQLAMGDWMIAGRDAMSDNLKGTSWRMAAGAKKSMQQSYSNGYRPLYSSAYLGK